MALAAALAALLGSARVAAGPQVWPQPRAEVLRLALSAASCAERAGEVDQNATLTVIDYSRPSTEPRLWVIDRRTRTVLFHEYVAHGRGSGDITASAFSNVPGSHQTSLGLFVTAETYTGQNGYSLRLDGLEPGINDRARERAIVIHGAPYVSESLIGQTGRVGRSFGCPAVRQSVARALIDRVRGGHLVFAYADDAAWLRSSTYLGACAAAGSHTTG